MSKLFERLLKVRGFGPEFLRPRYEDLAKPFDLPGVDEAVKRLASASSNSEKVLIYGDYDVDGVTASTVMAEALEMAGVQVVKIMLPDRFADGYGMSPRLVKEAERLGVSLVVTVDCGSHNHEIVDELSKLGIDTIVTDHHEVGESLPAAVAVVNPKRRDFDGGDLRELCGAGVAFKVAQALVLQGLIPAGQEKWLLDLVVLGTICDNMALTGENRILSYYGMKVLSKTRRAGLIELMRRAGVKNLNTETIGFILGPRLNAAGRLDTAELSLNLLRAKSQAEAAELALKLEELNKKRKIEQFSATKEISERGVGAEPVIVEAGKWHEGIVGIVAGRLVEEYRRPAFVLTEVSEGVYKGSGRSFGEFNLAEALGAVTDTIIGGGGHAGACGLRVAAEQMDDFREAVNEYYRSLKLVNQERFLAVTEDLAVSELGEFSLEFMEELAELEPFGAGNEEPIFKLVGCEILDVRKMGAEQNHLRVDMKDANGRTLKLVAFFAPEEWLTLSVNDKIEPLIKVNINEFNGVRSVEGRLVGL
ncbi:single-stranded-DNA-specific exonuclease RecJ [Candidatus Saccharibacteria bacterium]|nr:single-stranded-DNA-specific exonuclease RecJ [Candidatus Saccharibacteria bacterium]